MDNEPKVIDLVLGAKIIGENKTLALELIKNLAAKLPHDRDKVVTLYQQQQWLALQDFIHKLYGGVCYCGVPRLKFAVRNFDAALKHQAFDQIDDLHEQLLAEIDAVISEAVEFITKD